MPSLCSAFDPNRAWLEFPSGERRFLSETLTSIGRAPTNRVVIGSDRVSRNHAAIRWEEQGSFTLLDFGSSNGTFLNGQKVTRPVALRNGWIIEIGMQKFVFRTVPLADSSVGTPDPGAVIQGWLLALSAAALGCRTPGHELDAKTFEVWSARAQRILLKHRGRIMRGRDDGMLGFWPVISADSRAGTIIAAIRALEIVQRQNEEFRISLHYGSVNVRATPTGEEAPFGPEVIRVMQMDRLASHLRVPILISEIARKALSPETPTRRLSAEELRDRGGSQKYFTLSKEPR